MLVVQALQVKLAEHIVHLQAPNGQVDAIPEAGTSAAKVFVTPCP